MPTETSLFLSQKSDIGLGVSSTHHHVLTKAVDELRSGALPHAREKIAGKGKDRGHHRALAHQRMILKRLIEAVKERHPDASRKEIARAAFLSVIMSGGHSTDDFQALHDLARDTRDGGGA